MAKVIYDADRRKRQLIKKFHVLLGQQGLGAAAKEGILAGFGVEHTNELTLQQLSEACRALEAHASTPLSDREGAKMAEMDKWRKRVIAAAISYGKELGYSMTVEGAKGMALKATGNEYASFNRIPKTRLQALYNGFSKNAKTMRSTLDLAMEALSGAGEDR